VMLDVVDNDVSSRRKLPIERLVHALCGDEDDQALEVAVAVPELGEALACSGTIGKWQIFIGSLDLSVPMNLFESNLLVLIGRQTYSKFVEV
jgi:hypothetical protein